MSRRMSKAEPDVEIYTQPWCPYCARAKSILDRKGIAYREIDAPHGSPEREESIRRSGGLTTVPQIFVRGRHMGGSDELVALERTGALDSVFMPV
ncbi:MAG TPA: glutaredoxin 3 [Acidisphaera sp.]|nr:glutaredoxin 3 [Acidisphaera sp.]